jgi:hypothetical protein
MAWPEAPPAIRHELHFEDLRLSYHGLSELVLRTAVWLSAHGVSALLPGNRPGFLGSRLGKLIKSALHERAAREAAN